MAQRTRKTTFSKHRSTPEQADLARFKKAANKWAQDACKSKESATAALTKLGLLTPPGAHPESTTPKVPPPNGTRNLQLCARLPRL